MSAANQFDDRRLVITTILPPEGDTGVHTHVRELRAYLERERIASFLVTPFSWGTALSAPVFAVRLVLMKLGRLGSRCGVLWYYHWHEVFLRIALRRRLAGLGSAVIYAQDPRAARAALRARQGMHQRVIMAVHFHTSQADEWVDKGILRPGGLAYRVIRRIERDLTPQVDGIVYVADVVRGALLDWLPEAAAVRAAVIPNFIEPEMTREPDPVGDLVTIGGLLPAKNHAYLLEVLVAAREMGRSYTLDIFGAGPLQRELERACRSLGVQDQVRLRGFRPDVRRYLPGYRAYVHSSLREAHPFALIEAQAAELPVVAGDVGGVRSVCDPNSGARFWPLDDAHRAATVLIGLLDDEEARKSAAAASREHFSRTFSSHVVAPRLLAFLYEADVVPEAPPLDHSSWGFGRFRTRRRATT